MGNELEHGPRNSLPSQAERLDALEREVAEIKAFLDEHNPKHNARRIRIISKVLEGLSQSVRYVASKLR